MEHTKSKITVYSTMDYKRFRFIDGNRTTEDAKNKNKRSRIISEIKSGNDILDESPILVSQSNSHLDIKDGQNRFLIAKALNRPIHYIIKKESLSLYNLAKNNSNVEKWSADDYINCYITAGNKNYEQIRQFRKKYDIAISMTLMLLANGKEKIFLNQKNLISDFQQGIFEVKKWKDACMVAEICKGFQEFPHWTSRPFISAIIRILQADHCQFDRLMNKFQRDPKRLSAHKNVMGYISNLELIYNIDNQNRKTII
jgi:hypothetical protein